MTKNKSQSAYPISKSNDIRRAFLTYFKKRHHTLVPSSSLVPTNDPTLLFTNAGMVQFKDVFLGKESRPYKRAASAQRCVRAGGKHNDLERVGYTARHHTFFEMLGNFSFGDYFKREAIHFAWEFLVDELKLPPEKLWVTVYQEDEEAKTIWLDEMKIDPQRFSRCDEQDNFWSMGATGPCGPCTEIFYDHGPAIPGGPPSSENADGDRYVEIWNLVFMQFDRANDGTLTPLPKPSVDTGMGIERLAAVLQGVDNNFDTDLFQPLIHAAAKLAKINDVENFSLRVIADHIRSCSFLITDGVTPSNEGRGYVLRRIIRRALRHGNKLGITQPFFFQLVKPLVGIMGEAYPELTEVQTHVEKILLQEEEQFSTTLTQGLKLFDQVVQELQGDIIPGETVFKLYDTYGFPADLTADMARERHLMVDYDSFETEMAKQRERSRKASQFTTEYRISMDKPMQATTTFIGDKELKENEMEQGEILAIYREGKFVDHLNAGEKGSLVLDRTPFYAESGGQVGDQGLIHIPNKALFKVLDTIKQNNVHLHLGKLEKGHLRVSDKVNATVNANRRAAIVLNHTATHLLHRVLKEVLGEHALQKGSLVEAERLRFDFAHGSSLTAEQLQKIEQRVNEEIRANHTAKVSIETPQAAMAKGAVALFGEKYGSKVRMVQFGESIELCGGTHAENTGKIGLFKITAETGIAAGIRRIEAVTGEGALQFLKVREKEFKQQLNQAELRIHQLEKELAQIKDTLATAKSDDLLKKVESIGKIRILATKVEGVDGKALRYMLDHLKKQLGSAIIILATVKENKIGIVSGVTPDLIPLFHAKEIVNHLASQIGGRGGGRADMAEAGGNQPEKLEAALQSTIAWVQSKIK